MLVKRWLVLQFQFCWFSFGELTFLKGRNITPFANLDTINKTPPSFFPTWKLPSFSLSSFTSGYKAQWITQTLSQRRLTWSFSGKSREIVTVLSSLLTAGRISPTDFHHTRKLLGFMVKQEPACSEREFTVRSPVFISNLDFDSVRFALKNNVQMNSCKILCSWRAVGINCCYRSLHHSLWFVLLLRNSFIKIITVWFFEVVK